MLECEQAHISHIVARKTSSNASPTVALLHAENAHVPAPRAAAPCKCHATACAAAREREGPARPTVCFAGGRNALLRSTCRLTHCPPCAQAKTVENALPGAAQLRHYSASRATRSAESFLTGTSGAYVEEMFHAWKADPKRYVVVPACAARRAMKRSFVNSRRTGPAASTPPGPPTSAPWSLAPRPGEPSCRPPACSPASLYPRVPRAARPPALLPLRSRCESVSPCPT